MTREDLYRNILNKRSFLCIGLDPDPGKLPGHLMTADDPVFTFNRAIIDATHDLCVAYKPNLAFYEQEGSRGWESLVKTIDYIPDDCFIIADAKRGDIGNTANAYARTFFESLDCDAVTLSPYMGEDSIAPFLQYPGKWAILLALTSNKGSQDFQMIRGSDGQYLYEQVIRQSRNWGNPDNTMYVVGATHPDQIGDIRRLIPDHFLLVPGIGAQGGDLEQVAKQGLNDKVGLLVNASRSIIYASLDQDFATAARKQALEIREQMAQILSAVKDPYTSI